MKKFYIAILAFVFSATLLLAQAPNRFSYQTVVRNASGNLVANSNVGVRISILKTSASGTSQYSERHVVATNDNGLASLAIGAGTLVSGNLANINWTNDAYFIKTEIDPSGGSNYSISGTSQMMSVPYALSAANGNFERSGNNISNSNTGNVGIGTASPNTKLEVQGTITAGDFGPAGSRNLMIGDDAFFTDIDVNNRIGLYGITDQTRATLQLGNNEGASISGVNGNIGIGTTSPEFKLHVSGSNNAIKISGTGGSQSLGKLNFGDGDFVHLFEDVDDRLTIKANRIALQGGNVGIGTLTPDAPLTVGGTPMTTPARERRYFNAGTQLTYNGSATSGNVQIHSLGAIWCEGEFVATSDKRIKNIIGKTVSSEDLAVLNKIEVQNYRLIDQVQNDDRIHKKVIAQQVQKIYPTAIKQNSGIIPNVYEMAKRVAVKNNGTDIVTKKAHGFQTGDVVKLILKEGGLKQVTVTVINNHTFTVDEKLEGEVFVYGKKVEDLLSVDYDALSMLNVSATQELAKQVEALKAENAALKATISSFDSKFEALHAKLESIAPSETAKK